MDQVPEKSGDGSSGKEPSHLPYGKPFVIANRESGRGSLGGDPPALSALLDSAGLEYELEFTTSRGHAIELAAGAIKDGYRYLVAVGGDGSINEVMNGMLGGEEPPTGELVLGVLPDGSGSDFIRTFGLPPKPEDTISHLAGEAFFQVDVGKISYTNAGGGTSVRYFANIAEAGFGGEIARRAQSLPRSMGRWRYLLGFWLTLGRFKASAATVKLDQRSYQGPVTNLVVANAQFFGGGMRIAPKAHPADGKFDVLVMKGTKREYVAGISKVYKGNHLPSPAIKEYMTTQVEVTSERPLQIEADGEILGFTPATFEVIPNAYKLKI